MDPVVAHTSEGAALISVVGLAGSDLVHRYRIVSGPHDGAEFATLRQLITYAAAHGIQLKVNGR